MNTRRVLGFFTLTMLNVAAIASLRNLPIAATYGLSVIFIYVVTALLFFIPCALISAELATTFPETGGVYIWVERAFGPRWGFLAIWMQWIENVIWSPINLSFTAGIIAYIFNPSLAERPAYMPVMIIVIYWTATFLNLKGIRASGRVSSWGAVIGTLIPGLFIIGLGLAWFLLKKPLEFTLGFRELLPAMNPTNLVFIAGILFSFAGMELSAVHAAEVRRPNKNYPKSIFISALIIVFLFISGSLSIAAVIPKDSINPVTGLMEGFTVFFRAFGMSAWIPLLAALAAIGAIAQLNTWLIAPVKGIYATAVHGILPRCLQKTNVYGVPWVLLIVQAIIVTLLSLVFLVMPTIGSSFWLLSALALQIYIVMYFLMFLAAIRLRYKKPDIHRPYRILGGKPGIWIVGLTGFISMIAVFCIGFLPPEQIETGNPIFYEGFLITGLLFFGILPFLWKPSKDKVLKNP